MPDSRAIALSAARDITKCPKPLSPSTRAVAAAVRVTVMLGRRLSPPASTRLTYWARRNTPWASAPVRSASVISSAMRAASPAGICMAASASLMKARMAGAGAGTRTASAAGAERAAVDSPLINLAPCRRAPFLTGGAEHGGSLGAENGGAIGLGYAERAHLPHAFERTHVERIVAAEQHVRGPRPTDKGFELGPRVHDGVVIEPAQRGFRRYSERFLRFAADMPAVYPAPGLVGGEAAAVRQADLEGRMALQHAAEHDARGRDRGVERIADQVGEVVGAQPVGARDLHRMDQHEGADLG